MSTTKPTPRSIERFRQFVLSRGEPYEAAQAAILAGGLNHVVFDDMRTGLEDRLLLKAIYRYIDRARREPESMTALAVSWRGPVGIESATFATLFEHRLCALHRLDETAHGWNELTPNGRDGAGFTYTLRGEVLDVIALHDRAEALAFRFAYPTLLLTTHRQLATLGLTPPAGISVPDEDARPPH